MRPTQTIRIVVGIALLMLLGQSAYTVSDITHGVALAILLPHVVRWNAAREQDLHRPFVTATLHGRAGGSGDQLADRLVQIGRAGGFPDRLRDTGVQEQVLAALAEQAGQQWTASFNPVPFGQPDALEVYQCAY